MRGDSHRAMKTTRKSCSRTVPGVESTPAWKSPQNSSSGGPCQQLEQKHALGPKMFLAQDGTEGLQDGTETPLGRAP